MNLICGINPVLEALSAGSRQFDRLLVVKGLRNPRISDVIARAGQRGIPLRFESRETLDHMAQGVSHQGIIAVVSAKAAIDLDTLLEQAREPALVVVLDGVEDPRNLGAIVRTVEAAGADGVVLPERHSTGLSETVSRASAGALEHVRVARVGNLSQAIARLKEKGLWVVGFDAAGSQRWDAVDYKRPLAVVLGGEGRGIRRLVRENCDEVVSIPLFGHVSSLNVSVAAGIALFEVIRQRGSVPSHVKPIPARAAPPRRQIVGPAPGDLERDPGSLLPAVAARAEAPDEIEDLEHPIHLVGLHEDEAAWRHPAERAAKSEKRPHERDDRKRFRRMKQLHVKAHDVQPMERAGFGNDAERRKGGRRRRRRRPFPPGPHSPDNRRIERGGPPGSPPSAGEQPPQPDVEGGAAPPPRQPGPPGRGRRRRRRRRRH
jgi:23S rRNA (guanosine2251-2'-O)-methyltransferase